MTTYATSRDEGGDPATVKIFESAAAQNLLDYVHALQSVAANLEAGAIACAGGVAAFTGVGSPLTTIKGAGPEINDDDIDAAETFFKRCGADRVVFELNPWISPATKARLTDRGYELIGSEDVVVRQPPFETPAPAHRVETIEEKRWAEVMLQMNGLPDTPLWRAICEASAMLPDAVRFGVLDRGGDWIACAELLPAAGVGLFGNDATLESARGRGAQTATIHERLRAVAAQGLSCVAAEVAPGSGSERNYLRCGFHLAYARTHYARRL
jgi:hypothetical protein